MHDPSLTCSMKETEMMESVSIDDIRLLKMISDPQISPTGDQVAFVVTTINSSLNEYNSNIPKDIANYFFLIHLKNRWGKRRVIPLLAEPEYSTYTYPSVYGAQEMLRWLRNYTKSGTVDTNKANGIKSGISNLFRADVDT